MNPKLLVSIVPTAALMAFLGYFGSAHSPAYEYFDPSGAMLKVSISHASQRKEACVRRTPEEMAKLPPNMRVAQNCSRERSPVVLEVDLDGQPLMRETESPTGLSKDGRTTFYHRYRIPAGEHVLSIRMRDSIRSEGFDYVQEETVSIAPADLVVVQFLSEEQRFVVR